MNFVGSLCLGLEGSYDIGVKVEFKKKDPEAYSTQVLSSSMFPLNIISSTAQALLTNRVFKVLSFGYLHVFVHEMGHALASKILTGKNETCTIFTSSCTGVTTCSAKSGRVKSTIISLAGPLANVIFSVGLIFAAFAASSYVWWPIAAGIGIGASVWIVGELYYATLSTLSGMGDFGNIAQNGITHWVPAVAALVTPIALTALAL